MSAVTDQFIAANTHTAEVTLANRGFIRTTLEEVIDASRLSEIRKQFPRLS